MCQAGRVTHPAYLALNLNCESHYLCGPLNQYWNHGHIRLLVIIYVTMHSFITYNALVNLSALHYELRLTKLLFGFSSQNSVFMIFACLLVQLCFRNAEKACYPITGSAPYIGWSCFCCGWAECPI